MGIQGIKQGKLLYHLTRLSNLDSIIENGLVSRNLIKEHDVSFKDVADPNIISKRIHLGLESSVPFHFHPYSAFDVAVKSKYHEDEFVYICISRELAKHNKFKVLPVHPLSNAECNLYEYEEGFAAIDWDTMHAQGNETDYKKHVKMAECLTELTIPAKFFQSIYVKNEDSKTLVQEKLRANNIMSNTPYVNIGTWL